MFGDGSAGLCAAGGGEGGAVSGVNFGDAWVGGVWAVGAAVSSYTGLGFGTAISGDGAFSSRRLGFQGAFVEEAFEV